MRLRRQDVTTPKRRRRGRVVIMKEGQQSPIEFIMSVVNDKKVKLERRLELAQFAAPYVDTKKPAPPRQRTRRVGKAPKEPGKKVVLAKKAQNGHARTEWGNDLN